ncbi:hypothetical protein ASG41_13905 [Modestobacter sp. Leaf380]|nr:hypothetical protein ASG41_13905 [Modestobacter sp. Leaf380]
MSKGIRRHLIDHQHRAVDSVVDDTIAQRWGQRGPQELPDLAAHTAQPAQRTELEDQPCWVGRWGRCITLP